MKPRSETLQYGAAYQERLADSLPRVRERIAAAATESGRAPEDVRLVAVTKGHPVEAVTAALSAGIEDIGENRVEELEEKVAALRGAAVTWHMVGHVQSRKAARAVAASDWIHSVDSVRLAGKLARAAEQRADRARVLLQVNTSGEEAKSGFDPAVALEEGHRISEMEGLEVAGLMTMAPFVADEAALVSTFEALRRTLEALRRLSPRVGSELSMGMTNDMEIAIREGSTMVRIGTALFGERAS